MRSDSKKIKMSAYHIPQRKQTIEKYKRLQARYKELHEKERLRLDDCIETIKKEFFIQHDATVLRILRTEV